MIRAGRLVLLIMSLGLIFQSQGSGNDWPHEELKEAHRLLEIWDTSGAEKMIEEYLANNPEDWLGHYFKIQTHFLKGEYEKARELAETSGNRSGPENGHWLITLIKDTADAARRLAPHRSEHFIVFVDEEKDWILAQPALESLERARAALGGAFGFYPDEPIRVEIIPDTATFQKVSSLSPRDIEVSGAIGICKFNKIMVVSPRTLLRGYRWLDSLTHEYVHYCLVRLTKNQAPIWVHEGTAKYFEKSWKKAADGTLNPTSSTVLVEAMEEEDFLIPFTDMDPSLVKLDSAREVTLAFAECMTAVDFILSLTGREGFLSFLSNIGEMGRNQTREALQKVTGLNFRQFEEAWKKHVGGMKLEKVDNLQVKSLKLAENFDEEAIFEEEVESMAGRRHVRLGDRLRRRGRVKSALLEYKKAHLESPGSVYIMNKVAITATLINDYKTATQYIDKAIDISPDYPMTYLTSGNTCLAQGLFDKAVIYYREYGEINPFNPAIYRQEGMAHYRAGRVQQALDALEKAVRLNPGDAELRKQVEVMKNEI